MDEGRPHTGQPDPARVESVFRYVQAGRCAVAAAHDVNNRFGAIVANAELIGIESDLPPNVAKLLDTIAETARQGSDIVNALAEATLDPDRAPRPIDFGMVVENALALKRHDMKRARIQAVVEIADGLPVVEGGRLELQQALLCLLSNAVEALNDENERELRVSVRGSNGVVATAVWNAGPAIEDPAPLFEPYYTTKDGPHLGLGLTVARAIAEAHGGTLEYRGPDGFVMELPGL